MNLAPQHTLPAQDSPATYAIITEWHTLVIHVVNTLRKLAGTTEDEFLLIGSRMQDFHQRSSEITATAKQLVELVSGYRTQSLVDGLQRMTDDMEAYLANARSRNSGNCQTLGLILKLLNQASQPLEAFQKIYKVLRMLSTSTKIESSRLGEMGNGFLTLALDVERLSGLVNEKSSGIMEHRRLLEGMIGNHLLEVRAVETVLNREMGDSLAKVNRSTDELTSVRNHCAGFGSMISSVSGEVSANIGIVISSVQMHDMTRQQVEHIVEALERLSDNLRNSDALASDTEECRNLIIEAGDVCELQSAQLRFASSVLCGAVGDIIGNLRNMAGKLALIASQTTFATGAGDSKDASFVDTMSHVMTTATSVLTQCANSDRDILLTLSRVAEMMQELTGFVSDIENIGADIDLIALNAQIKAAHTGRDGAALGVLAEAIKRLSVDAVCQTQAVSGILLEVKQSTAQLFSEATHETKRLGAGALAMENELGGIMNELDAMNKELIRLLAGLNSRVSSLTADIERVTDGIDGHERVAGMTDEVRATLDRIVEKARELEPASTEFNDNLRHMEKRYTMDSERHIHEAIALNHSGFAGTKADQTGCAASSASDESEFGENVELF